MATSRLDCEAFLAKPLLDGDQAVAAGDDPLNDPLLAAHGVHRDELAGRADLLQELRDGCHLVGLSIGGDRVLRDRLLAGPADDEM